MEVSNGRGYDTVGVAIIRHAGPSGEKGVMRLGTLGTGREGAWFL